MATFDLRLGECDAFLVKARAGIAAGSHCSPSCPAHPLSTLKSMASTALEQQKRYEKLTNAAADAAPPWAAKYIRMLAPITGSIAAGAAVLWPYLVWALETGYQLYLITPTNLMMAMVGLVFCFFVIYVNS